MPGRQRAKLMRLDVARRPTPMYAPIAPMCRTRSARNLPFASSASSASVTVSRACWSDRKDSERLAIQATGRPVSFAADQQRRIFRIGRTS